ncbi:zeta toxin family protein [Stratiformator vulcanicus]|uniref:Zeta toxin n=1 Tax=Stratiformator vulcanicus TaxID=2527980 RepID=A0A517QZF2_9PLAN|nr:zeta toxin family protein [Stratiformator vulcanicus]QDT37027.1 Zeta toxin [Stratiformator vulcanicus]
MQLGIDWALFDQRPLLICIAGSNGAGKSTFFHSQLKDRVGLPFVNADVLAEALEVGAYEAAEIAESVRQTFVEEQRSFVFETVLSDPVGAKVEFLRQAGESGYTVVMCFVGIGEALTSQKRVAMRVLQGGHDVPDTKIFERFDRTLANLRRAIDSLPHVLVYDNSDLNHPYRLVAAFESSQPIDLADSLPEWLTSVWSRG